jgi:hypothetical protein
MKSIIVAMTTLVLSVNAGYSQNINWKSIHGDQQNIVQLSSGYDFGITTQLGFARSVNLFRPAIVGLDFSLPMGSDLLDDFKVKLGGQMEVFEMDGFSASVKIFSVFRRYENELVRAVSFGSDFGAVAGYYGSTWHAAGEFGFDKSIATHLKHSDIMKTYFPAIKDGWYVPTGGHFYYGIQGGKTIGDSYDISLRVGATRAQDNDDNAVLPFYAQLGLGLRF